MGDLHDSLDGKTPAQCHALKAAAWADLPDVPRAIAWGDYVVAIDHRPVVSIVDGMLEFTIRITKDDVDVTPARMNPIRVHNPPYTVRDAGGDIEEEIRDPDGQLIETRKYSENIPLVLLGLIRDLLRSKFP